MKHSDQNTRFLAKTFYGFESILAKELMSLGAKNIKELNRMVAFEGDLGFMYKANFSLGCALRILMPIGTFRVTNQEQLYDAVKSIPWQHYFSPEKTFAIDSGLFSDRFSNSLFLSQKAKDAIVDYFREKTRKRPSVDTSDPQIRINLHLSNDTLSVALDSSGVSLHQRGYKTVTNIAPINEVLAAGILHLSDWHGQRNFFDPMCGSGTLAIEAALIACKIPHGIHRASYSFMHWNSFDSPLWEKIKESALNKVKEFPFTIYAQDKAPSAVRKTEENAENAGLSEYIQVQRADFFKTLPPTASPLHMVFNPPYGERLDIDEIPFYKEIGNTLKQHYNNSEVWLISSNLEALKHLGLKPFKKTKLYNGKLEAKLQGYRLYSGSLKEKY
ncbi:MAG: THUMP domain-containing class I SAM-dependent RNA methyltransferase [Flavobacteriaceae bacterium]